MEPENNVKDIIPEVKLGDSRILFLDVSSSCTGYTIAGVDFLNKKATLLKAGCIWLDPNWEHAKKYDYMYNAVQVYFDVVEQADHIIVEQYSVNPDKMSGVLVSPEMHGAIKAAAYSNGVKVTSILPQSWRSILKIKPTVELVGGKKKRDFKEPTKNKVLESVTVPPTVTSNITKKERQTPSDVYDAIAICLAWLTKNEFKINTKDCEFNGHIGALNESVD